MFLDSRFQNHPDSVILQKHQLLSNQSFNHNSTHMLSLYLTPTFPFEPRFRTFIINGHYTKSKRLQSLNSLFVRKLFSMFPNKSVLLFVFCFFIACLHFTVTRLFIMFN